MNELIIETPYTLQALNNIDYLKQTLEEDEERHGEAPRDKDTGEKLEKPGEGPKDAEDIKEEKEKKQKDDDDTDTDDEDDNGSGGLLMPVIEWIGKLIPRAVKEPKS